MSGAGDEGALEPEKRTLRSGRPRYNTSSHGTSVTVSTEAPSLKPNSMKNASRNKSTRNLSTYFSPAEKLGLQTKRPTSRKRRVSDSNEAELQKLQPTGPVSAASNRSKRIVTRQKVISSSLCGDGSTSAPAAGSDQRGECPGQIDARKDVPRTEDTHGTELQIADNLDDKEVKAKQLPADTKQLPEQIEPAPEEARQPSEEEIKQLPEKVKHLTIEADTATEIMEPKELDEPMSGVETSIEMGSLQLLAETDSSPPTHQEATDLQHKVQNSDLACHTEKELHSEQEQSPHCIDKIAQEDTATDDKARDENTQVSALPNEMLIKYSDSLSDPQQTPTRRRPTPKQSRFFPGGTRDLRSCLLFPPSSAKHFGLIQERLAHEPFQLLIAVIFLHQTKGAQAVPVLLGFLSVYATPDELAAAKPSSIEPFIRALGLQRKRAQMLIALANAWVEQPPEKGRRFRARNYPAVGDGADISVAEQPLDDADPRSAWEIAHLPGVGAYALDSWRIFCRDMLRRGETSRPRIIRGEEDRAAELDQEWTRVLPLDKELRVYLQWRWIRLGFLWDPNTGNREEVDLAVVQAMERGEMRSFAGYASPWLANEGLPFPEEQGLGGYHSEEENPAP